MDRQITMKFLHKVYILIPLLVLIIFMGGCNNNLDNRHPDPLITNPGYDAQIKLQEEKVNTLSQRAQDQDLAFVQGADTEKISQAYLGTLYATINSSRPDGMPLWEEMFTSLISEEAIMDPEFTLGRMGLVTNFYKQQQFLLGHEAIIRDHEMSLSQHEKQIADQDALAHAHDQIIGRLEKVMLDANAEIAAQIKVVEDTIKNFDIRVKAMETEGDKKRQAVANFERRISILESSVDGILKELEEYKLAEMSGNIRQLQKDFTDAGTRIVNLETDVINVGLDIKRNADDIIAENNKLNYVRTNLEFTANGLNLYMARFLSDRDAKIKEITERLAILEALLWPPVPNDPAVEPDPPGAFSEGGGI